jgi:hypothetical protein
MSCELTRALHNARSVGDCGNHQGFCKGKSRMKSKKPPSRQLGQNLPVHYRGDQELIGVVLTFCGDRDPCIGIGTAVDT